MTDTSKVSFSESLEVKARKIGETLEKMRPDLLLANCSGSVHSEVGPRETESYGFLVKGTEQRFLGRLWVTRSRHFIGVLWFKNEIRQATHKKWVLEVYGRENVDSLKEMAEQLSKQFEVEIHVRLSSEHHKFEYIPD